MHLFACLYFISICDKIFDMALGADSVRYFYCIAAHELDLLVVAACDNSSNTLGSVAVAVPANEYDT
jgi:hypothetical protein